MIRRIFFAQLVLLVIIIMLAGCSESVPDKKPPNGGPAGSRIYMPLVTYNVCAPSPKKSVAGNWFGAGVSTGWKELCLESDAIWHQWTPWIWYQPGNPVRLPFVWSDEILEFRRAVPAGYRGVVMFANEPDIKTQANMTPEETARIAMDILQHCDCTVAGPNISQLAVGTSFIPDFWREFVRLGGSAEAVSKTTFHYYDCVTGLSFSETLDAFMLDLPAELRDKPVWVTEIGSCLDSYEDASALLSEASADQRVERWFYFIAQGWGLPVPFSDSGELTGVGRAIRDAN